MNKQFFQITSALLLMVSSKAWALPAGCSFSATDSVYACPAQGVRIVIRNTGSDSNTQFTASDVQSIVTLLGEMPFSQLRGIPYIESASLRTSAGAPVIKSQISGMNPDGGLYFRIDNASYPSSFPTSIDTYLPDAIGAHVYEKMLTDDQRNEWAMYVQALNSTPKLDQTQYTPEELFLTMYHNWMHNSDETMYDNMALAPANQPYRAQMLLFMTSLFADPSGHFVNFYSDNSDGQGIAKTNVAFAYNGAQLTVGPIRPPVCTNPPCGTYQFFFSNNQITSMQLPGYNPYSVGGIALPTTFLKTFGPTVQIPAPFHTPQTRSINGTEEITLPSKFAPAHMVVSPVTPNASYEPWDPAAVKKHLSIPGQLPGDYSPEHGVN